jgi:hypothetical protein
MQKITEERLAELAREAAELDERMHGLNVQAHLYD